MILFAVIVQQLIGSQDFVIVVVMLLCFFLYSVVRFWLVLSILDPYISPAVRALFASQRVSRFPRMRTKYFLMKALCKNGLCFRSG